MKKLFLIFGILICAGFASGAFADDNCQDTTFTKVAAETSDNLNTNYANCKKACEDKGLTIGYAGASSEKLSPCCCNTETSYTCKKSCEAKGQLFESFDGGTNKCVCISAESQNNRAGWTQAINNAAKDYDTTMKKLLKK